MTARGQITRDSESPGDIAGRCNVSGAEIDLSADETESLADDLFSDRLATLICYQLIEDGQRVA
ncbi:hypothetical protein BMS3Bbin04_00950 [bacterium BMS3Bbin04]|nr:hypothetical protein BMS3Bbin04_00950 [bacterium BMS3Bbin04]